jgi:hypothetical protein
MRAFVRLNGTMPVIRRVFVFALCVPLLFALQLDAARKTRNVILVTADGLRWQELFGGIDPLLMNEKVTGMQQAPELRAKLWRTTPEERRKALMPFFWNELAPKGVVFGNLEKKSSVRVTNRYHVSYPGYSEILTGRAQDDVIRGNDEIQNPTPTVLQFLREKLGLDKSKVALFGSWDTFSYIGESQPGSIFINTGYREHSSAAISPRMRELSALQFDMLTPAFDVRHDFVTFEMALEYLKREEPRLLHIALGETDDWAHDKRYDRVLNMIGYLDRSLNVLWRWLQSSPSYRDSTTLIVTCDHGRGNTLEDWTSHGEKIPESQQIWIAMVGPDTPARGEAADAPEVFQRDIAPTIIDLLGFDYRDYQGVLGKPIQAALLL